jgi:TetR/AcrR family transcriptional regulator, transcriptional repressor for nem operon
MRKGEQTREMILARVAPVFNQQGYFGSSLSDIMRETGLEKGGIYNHFRSKDELALAAFDYSVGLVWQQIEQELVGKTSAVDRLLAMIHGYRQMLEDPTILPGGCPLLNTAIESDDAHPALRERARQTMTRWRKWIQKTITRGITSGEIRPEADADAVATIIIITLEGAIMMSRLYDNTTHMQRAVEHLAFYLKTIQA